MSGTALISVRGQDWGKGGKLNTFLKNSKPQNSERLLHHKMSLPILIYYSFAEERDIYVVIILTWWQKGQEAQSDIPCI